MSLKCTKQSELREIIWRVYQNELKTGEIWKTIRISQTCNAAQTHTPALNSLLPPKSGGSRSRRETPATFKGPPIHHSQHGILDDTRVFVSIVIFGTGLRPWLLYGRGTMWKGATQARQGTPALLSATQGREIDWHTTSLMVFNWNESSYVKPNSEIWILGQLSCPKDSHFFQMPAMPIFEMRVNWCHPDANVVHVVHVSLSLPLSFVAVLSCPKSIEIMGFD